MWTPFVLFLLLLSMAVIKLVLSIIFSRIRASKHFQNAQAELKKRASTSDRVNFMRQTFASSLSLLGLDDLDENDDLHHPANTTIGFCDGTNGACRSLSFQIHTWPVLMANNTFSLEATVQECFKSATAVADASLRAELTALNLSGLKKRARAEGLDEDTVDDVDDKSNPKVAIIELLVKVISKQTVEPEPELEYPREQLFDSLAGPAVGEPSDAITRNAGGSEEPHSEDPELWNVEGTEVDLCAKYKVCPFSAHYGTQSSYHYDPLIITAICGHTFLKV
jgi:hypothetical protein